MDSVIFPFYKVINIVTSQKLIPAKQNNDQAYTIFYYSYVNTDDMQSL